MNVDTISKNKIKISLTTEEIFFLFGGYDRIDYGDPKAKSTINKLLKEALPQTMFPLDCNRVLIEVRPEIAGCSIYFTKIFIPRKLKRVPEKKDYTLCFKNSELLLNAIHGLYPHCKETKSDLYRLGEQYRLILHTKRHNSPSDLLIREYCTDVSTAELNRTVTEEYGKIICKENAIQKIACAFYKQC